MANTTFPLESCCIYLWQRVDGDAMPHAALTAKIKELGGKVAPRFSKEVTHVIFQRIFQPTTDERLAEDAELRNIYGRVSKVEPQAIVVNPLWLRDTEAAGARAKERKYVVRKPADPIFLTSPTNPGNAAAKRKRKSYARPREQVEVPDFDDALFSSSQQIRDLNGAPGKVHERGHVSALPSLSDSEDFEGERQRRPAPMRAASVPSLRVPSEDKAPATTQEQKHRVDLKRPMRQLPLAFAVIGKKQRVGSAAAAGARGDGPLSMGFRGEQQQPQQPMALVTADEQPSRDASATTRAAGPKSCNPTVLTAASQQPGTGSSKPPSAAPPLLRPPQPRSGAPQQMQQLPAGGATQAAPEPVMESLQRAPSVTLRYPELPCSVAPAGGGAQVGRLAQGPPAGAPRRHSLGPVHEPGEKAAKTAPLGPAPTSHVRRASALPPRPPVLSRGESGAGECDGTAPAASVAPPLATAAATATDAPAAALPERAQEGATGNPNVSAAPATGTRAASRCSGHRRSRSLAGTPLLANGRPTPVRTPKALTPGALVMPRLKSMGSGAAASGTPAMPEKVAAEPQAPETVPGPNTAQAAVHGPGCARGQELGPEQQQGGTAVPVLESGPRATGTAAALDTPALLGGSAAAVTAKQVGAPPSGSAINPIVVPDSAATVGDDNGRRPQGRTLRVTRLGPLALSPLAANGDTPNAGPLPAPVPASEAQGHAVSAAGLQAVNDGAAVPPPERTGARAAPTPGPGRRFSARLAAASPLPSVPPSCQPRSAVYSEKEADAATAQPLVLQEQQQQEQPTPRLIGAARVQRPCLDDPQPSAKKPNRELARLLEGAAPAEERSAAAGPTPATTRKARLRRQAAATGGAEVDCADHQPLQLQRQSTAAVANQAPQQREASGGGVAPDPALVLPSPALCTRSRASAAEPSPRIAGGATGQPPLPDKPLKGAITHQASSKTCRREADQSDPGLPQPWRLPGLALPGEDAAGGGAHSSGPVGRSSPRPEAPTPGAMERPGTVTRSRQRALEAERDGAVQAPPPSTAGRRKGSAFTRAAALLENAAEAQTAVAAGDIPNGKQQPHVPGAGSGATAMPPRPPRPALPRLGAASTAAGPTAPAPTQVGGADACASKPTSENPGADAGSDERASLAMAGPTPLVATPKGSPPAGRPPRPSTCKRPRETLASKPAAQEPAVGNVQGVAGPGCATTSAAETAMKGTAAEMLRAPRPAAGPVSRSRLRLRQPDASAAQTAPCDGVLQRSDPQTSARAGAPGSAAMDTPAAKRRRTLLASANKASAGVDGGRSTAAVASAAAPAGPVGDTSRPNAAERALLKAEAAPQQEAAPPAPAPAGTPTARLGVTSNGKAPGRRAAALGAAAAGSGSVSRSMFRSVALAAAGPSPAVNRALGSASAILRGGGGKSSRLAMGSCIASGSRSALEPLPIGNAEVSAAPALGQYPRGKEHPMRAGYRYLAHTRVGKEMEEAIEMAVKQLGHARMCTAGYEDGHVTHLVVGDAECRTIKILVGIANGALLVKPSWVAASIAAGQWAPEEEHLVEGPFAVTANAVRAQLQAQQQQRGSAEGGPAAPPPSAAVGVVAKPLAERMVAVLNPQCKGRGLADLQKRKNDLEKLVGALGGRVTPLRSADLLIVVQGSTNTAERPKVPVATEDWLKRLAETHIWQEPC